MAFLLEKMRLMGGGASDEESEWDSGESDGEGVTETVDAKYVKEKLAGRIPLYDDTYGVVQLCLLCVTEGENIPKDEDDPDDLSAWCALIHGLVFNTIAMAMQVFALFLYYTFINDASVAPYQRMNWRSLDGQIDALKGGVNMNDATVELTKAVFINKHLDENNEYNKGILGICDGDKNVPFATTLFLSILAVQLLSKLIEEISDIINFLLRVPTGGDDEIFLLTDPKDDGRLVAPSANRKAKSLLFFLVFLPRVLITLLTFRIGAGSLTLAGSVYLVVLKCMGVGLIGSIPQVINTAFIEETTKANVAKTSIAHTKERKEAKQEMWKLWLFPGLKFVLAFGVSWYIVHVTYGDIHALRNACFQYGNNFIKPACRAEWPCGAGWPSGQVFYNNVASFGAADLEPADSDLPACPWPSAGRCEAR